MDTREKRALKKSESTGVYRVTVTVHPPQAASGTGGKAGASSPLRRAAIT
jgi:hypothetical protein